MGTLMLNGYGRGPYNEYVKRILCHPHFTN